MFYDEQHRIYKNHPLYEWCNKICHDTTNLKNAVRFRQRNLYTGLSKNPSDRHPLEQQVINEFEQAIFLMNKKYKDKISEQQESSAAIEDIPDKYDMPTPENPYASYAILVGVMSLLNNPDYNTDALCANASQKTIKLVYEELLSFAKSLKAYNINPERFSGRPGLPGYARKGSATTAVLTNDGVHYNEHVGKHGTTYYSLTLPKAPSVLELGTHLPKGRIKEIRIVPCLNFFIIHICSDDDTTPPTITGEPKRVAAIDLGVDNFAAVVNNCGLPCLLFKGGTLKADNQYYNKMLASAQSRQMKGGETDFEITEQKEKIIDYRNNRVRDFCLKVSKRIVDWCIENRIDTLICGSNKGWKQNVNLGKRNNQEFVFIPHSQFVSMLSWRCERYGIRFMEVEESYTSKASFLDGDFIPTYGEEVATGGWKFSGYRSPTVTYWRRVGQEGETQSYKVKPRGLYKSHKHGIVNSDLNGSANMIRKHIGDEIFTCEDSSMPIFSEVKVYSHPDEEFDLINREKQLENKQDKISNAKLKRLISKGKRSPTGIGLCG